MFKLLRIGTIGVLSFASVGMLIANPNTLPKPMIQGQAVIKSEHEVMVSSQIDGKVNKIVSKEGDRFKKGDTLLTFDCRLFKAEHEKALAERNNNQVRYKSSQKLSRLDGISDVDLAQAKGDYLMSVADAKAKSVIVEHCQIIAPFDGAVSKLHVKTHQAVKAGDLLIELVDNQNLQVEMLVPSQWLNWLKVGKHFTFLSDDTGQRFQAKITKVVPKIDAISKTIKVIGSVNPGQQGIIPGMSGIGKFEK